MAARACPRGYSGTTHRAISQPDLHFHRRIASGIEYLSPFYTLNALHSFSPAFVFPSAAARAFSTASLGVLEEIIDLTNRPFLESDQVFSPMTGILLRRAQAISERVPYWPPMAITACAELTTITFRASPTPVTMGISTYGLASSRLFPGRIPTRFPFAERAPLQDAAIPPPHPPPTKT